MLPTTVTGETQKRELSDYLSSHRCSFRKYGNKYLFKAGFRTVQCETPGSELTQAEGEQCETTEPRINRGLFQV